MIFPLYATESHCFMVSHTTMSRQRILIWLARYISYIPLFYNIPNYPLVIKHSYGKWHVETDDKHDVFPMNLVSSSLHCQSVACHNPQRDRKVSSGSLSCYFAMFSIVWSIPMTWFSQSSSKSWMTIIEIWNHHGDLGIPHDLRNLLIILISSWSCICFSKTMNHIPCRFPKWAFHIGQIKK